MAINCREERRTRSSLITYLGCSILILFESAALAMLIPVGMRFGSSTLIFALVPFSAALAIFYYLSFVINKRVICIEKNGDSLKLVRIFSSSVLPIDSISKLVEFKGAADTVLQISFNDDGTEKKLEMNKSKAMKYEDYREVLERSCRGLTIIGG